ncbi:MAG: PAS domain-containing protein, partial [Myxococcales bacterium]|nr:PAS domain-containing protein [Myxococcales bacterium]
LSHADLGEYNVLHDPSLEEKGILELMREVFAGQARALPMIPYTLPRGEFAGQPRWVRAFAYPVLEPSGRLREVVLIHEDITERVRAEEALQRAQRMESIGVLAGGVAHDFNNLLTGILGYAELALHALPPAAPAAQHLRQVLSASNRAAELTRQLLAYAGKGRYVVARIDLSDTVREMRDLVHASVSRAIAVELDLD